MLDSVSRTTARSLILIFLCLCVFDSLLAQNKYKLVDDAPITISGRVIIEHRGNNSYRMLKPTAAYEAVFDASDRRTVTEIGLSLEGQGENLDRLVGQEVTVSGRLQLEPTSPYYFNGTLILANAVRISDGRTLFPVKIAAAPLPQELQRFNAVVTFSPRSRERFTYQAWDAFGHLLPRSYTYLSCGLNGPGDVMNCYCADGFKFVGTGAIENGKFIQMADPYEGFDFAQFVIADPVRHYVREGIRCAKDDKK